MARKARGEGSANVVGALIAHFAFAPVAEAEQTLKIAQEVLRQRGANGVVKRGPGRPAGSGANASGPTAVVGGTQAGPQPVGAVKPKRVRDRRNRKRKGAVSDAPAGTPVGVAEAGDIAVVDASPAVAEPTVAEVSQPLPDQAAGDQ